MTATRRLRLAQAILVSVLLVVGTSSTALAATASVDVGGGTTLGTHDSGATPSTIRLGNVVGIYLWATNTDNANLATFFLSASTEATPIGAYWWTPSAPNDVHPCSTSGGLSCEFGAFNAGASVQVLAAFRTTKSNDKNCGSDPALGAVPPAGASAQCFHFLWGSHSGFVLDKNNGNNSRGDAYDWYDYVSFSANADEAAGFPFCVPGTADCAGLSVSDVQSLGKNNPQWTQATVPATAANSVYASSGVRVSDNVNFSCPASQFPDECADASLGQWSEVRVNQGGNTPYGQTFEQWVQVDVGIYGVNANKISTVYHFYKDDLGNWQVETLGLCAASTGPATLTSPACFWVQGLQGNSSLLQFWTHHNGFGKFG